MYQRDQLNIKAVSFKLRIKIYFLYLLILIYLLIRLLDSYQVAYLLLISHFEFYIRYNDIFK